MKILFLTMADIKSINDGGIYMDLMRTFVAHGDEVVCVSPLEEKNGGITRLEVDGRLKLLKARTGDLFGVGMATKLLSQMKLSRDFYDAIMPLFGGGKFDLILYPTPPIFIEKIVRKLKVKYGARTYLLLKDIFPRNGVDIGLYPAWLAKLAFSASERRLYGVSDFIGCMSEANKKYLLENTGLDASKVEVCPNTITPSLVNGAGARDEAARSELLRGYGIPEGKVLFLYGGNLGKPQDVPFILRCIKAARDKDWAHFVICGSGTEAAKVAAFSVGEGRDNLTYIPGLPKEEYDALAEASDVGLIFLDHRFTIPNFPSRLLSYMDKSLPVLAATDKNTDIGEVVESGGFGKWCSSDAEGKFVEVMESFRESASRKIMGDRARKYLEEHYTSEIAYGMIKGHFQGEN